MRDIRNLSETSKPILPTGNTEMKKNWRYGLLSVGEYVKKRASLFINTYIILIKSKARVLPPSSFGNLSTLRSFESSHLCPWKKCTIKIIQ